METNEQSLATSVPQTNTAPPSAHGDDCPAAPRVKTKFSSVSDARVLTETCRDAPAPSSVHFAVPSSPQRPTIIRVVFPATDGSSRSSRRISDVR